MHAMKEGDSSSSLDWELLQPPPYLLGMMLVIWGIASGNPFLGVMAAVLLEWHRWVHWRWDFTDQDYVRVWNLCVALFLIVAVFQVVGKELGRWQVTRAFQQWIPLLLFPMIWAQNFSRRPSVPLLTFSLVARRKRLVDQRAGRRIKPPRRVPLGYFYFAVLLLSIGAVSRRAPTLGELMNVSSRSGIGSVSLVYLGVAVLLAWALLVLVPRRGWWMGAIMVAVASLAGHQVHIGLRLLHGFVEHKTMEWIADRGGGNAEHSVTSFGEVGELKLSPRVHWRARYEESYESGTGVPSLLAEATYQLFWDGKWRNPRQHGHPRLELFQVEGRNQWEITDLPVVDSTGAMMLRGHAKGQQLLPRLDDTALVYDLEASSLRRNLLGTLEARPNYGSIKYTVYSGKLKPGQLEMKPHPTIDLSIRSEEKSAVQEVVDSLALPAGAGTREKIAAVVRFFSDSANGFRYSKWLEDTGESETRGRRTPLARFLDPKGRRGHCEFYAAATALILRAFEVPTRYVVGYAMQEIDPRTQEFILRGTHRHSWARAWIEEEKQWINIDTTPSDWFSLEEKALTGWQRFLERWDYWMLSWNLWRRHDNKGLLWTMLPLLLAGGLLIVVVLRLVRGLRMSRQEIADGLAGQSDSGTTILGADSAWFRLEKLLGERCGERPPSQSAASWCRQLLASQPAWKGILPRIIDFHYRYRFDPEGIAEEERRSFEQAVEGFSEQLIQEPKVDTP